MAFETMQPPILAAHLKTATAAQQGYVEPRTPIAAGQKLAATSLETEKKSRRSLTLRQ